jgi:hypothetical protein
MEVLAFMSAQTTTSSFATHFYRRISVPNRATLFGLRRFQDRRRDGQESEHQVFGLCRQVDVCAEHSRGLIPKLDVRFEKNLLNIPERRVPIIVPFH